jgi:hypothetical protein
MVLTAIPIIVRAACPPVQEKPFSGQKALEKELASLVEKNSREAKVCTQFAEETAALSGELMAETETPFFKNKSDFIAVVTRIQQYSGVPTSYQKIVTLLIERVPPDAYLFSGLNIVEIQTCNEMLYFKIWKYILWSLDKYPVAPNELQQVRNGLTKFLESDAQRPLTLIGLLLRLNLTELAFEKKLFSFSGNQERKMKEILIHAEKLHLEADSRNDKQPTATSEAERCAFQRKMNGLSMDILRKVEPVRKEYAEFLKWVL